MFARGAKLFVCLLWSAFLAAQSPPSTELQSKLAEKEKTLGPNHPEVAAAWNDLAIAYQKEGKASAAESSEQKAVSIFQKSLGEYQPDTATAVNNWADILAANGKMDDALPLYNRSIDIKYKTLGPDHPDLAKTYIGLGAALAKQRKYDEALSLYQRALDILVRSLGPEELGTGEALLNVADTTAAKGNMSLARAYLARIREIFNKHASTCPPGAQAPTSDNCRRLARLRDGTLQLEAKVGP
jgi:tetratricopeptide (TPR) repeat protein